jgi:glutamyl-Q tRNA(Asp) synthetase
MQRPAAGDTRGSSRKRESAPSIGRFAPSPNGPLHLGSLVTAAASLLEARAHAGHWLVRIEDLDPQRSLPGIAAQQLRTLESLGFEWDGPIWYQSERHAAYAAALEQLRLAGHTYRCSCSRREVAEADPSGAYPGTCRARTEHDGATAVRLRTEDERLECFLDLIQGPICLKLAELGDPVLRRRDGAYAYQLAVVIDDAAQGVTEVVRGADLLASTAWQRVLQRALALPEVSYAHVPLVTEPDGSKLAKSRHSPAVPEREPGALLSQLFSLLKMTPPADMQRANPAQLWQWAHAHWTLAPLRSVLNLPLIQL